MKRELAITTREVMCTKCLAFRWLVVIRTTLLGNGHMDVCWNLETTANINNFNMKVT